MPRRARVRIENIPLHVVQRGIDRAPCFRKLGDYVRYLHELTELAEEFACSVHAYVLMTNHVHLLVTPARFDGVSLLMKNLGQRYVQQFNRVHGRTGALWEGRYRASFVESGTYLFRCYRYIELNPVRAGMVARPGEYFWSSYATNAEGQPSALVKPHPDFVALGCTEPERQKAYRELFGSLLATEEIDEIRRFTRSGFALGGRSFCQRMSTVAGRRLFPAPERRSAIARQR